MAAWGIHASPVDEEEVADFIRPVLFVFGGRPASGDVLLAGIHQPQGEAGVERVVVQGGEGFHGVGGMEGGNFGRDPLRIPGGCHDGSFAGFVDRGAFEGLPHDRGVFACHGRASFQTVRDEAGKKPRRTKPEERENDGFFHREWVHLT